MRSINVEQVMVIIINCNEKGFLQDLQIGNVFQWYKNCSATVLICSTRCSTSGGAPTKLTSNLSGSFSGATDNKLTGRERVTCDEMDVAMDGRMRAIESSDSIDVSILTKNPIYRLIEQQRRQQQQLLFLFLIRFRFVLFISFFIEFICNFDYNYLPVLIR